MTNLEELKLFTNFYIDEHERLTEDEKHYLHTFVKDSSIFEIENLLVTGNPKRLTHREQNIGSTLYKTMTKVDPSAEYSQSGSELIKLAGKSGLEGMAIAAVVALVTTLAYRAYKRYLTTAARKCTGLSGSEKTICIKKHTKAAREKQISVIRSNMKQCTKSKDPGKCKQKLIKKIRDLKAKGGQYEHVM